MFYFTIIENGVKRSFVHGNIMKKVSHTLLATAIFTTISSSAIAKDQQKQNLSAFVSEAKATLTRDFKDPESAMFRNLGVYKSNDELFLCGEVNSKNSFGGYVGYSLFSASKNDAKILRDDESDVYVLLHKLKCEEKIKSVK